MPDTPRAQRTCLCCGLTFEGTPKATRCKPCRTTGHKVPAKVRAKHDTDRIERPDLPQYDKTCVACGSGFHTHKTRAVRCTPCIDANRKVPKRTCLECKKPFTVIDDADINCGPCADMLGIFQYEMSTEQAAKALEQENLERHQETLKKQTKWLNQRERPPTGYPTMNKANSSTTLATLWVQLCAADGAASSLMYTTTTSNLNEDTKVTLLTTFFRLRAKGYHPSAISKLCPESILKQATQEALTDLPKVTESAPEDELDVYEWDRVATAATLGLSNPITQG